jgi:hypothetical protein
MGGCRGDACAGWRHNPLFEQAQAKPISLRETDSVLLADFTNTTGDPVFDGTLQQGLEIQLKQSPFLSLVSEQRVQQTLRMMGKPADSRLAPEIGREVCERTASAAVLDGSIAKLGSQNVWVCARKTAGRERCSPMSRRRRPGKKTC